MAATVTAGKRRLRVLPTQEAIVPDQIGGSAVVVVDNHLATTTLLTIMANGARRVFAARDLDEVDRFCGGLDGASLVRGGEQNALAVDGFDCGAYPHEYGADVVRGKDVVYVSTNGTRAIGRAADARRVYVGSLRNAPALARVLDRSDEESVIVVCAGSRGGFSLEDFAAARVLLTHLDLDDWKINDAAWVARDLVGRDPSRLPELIRSSRAGSWFVRNGRTDVLEFAAAVGATDLVAEVQGGELVAVDPP